MKLTYLVCMAKFSEWGATGVAFVRSCEKFPLCPMESMPAGSKTGPLLAKAKPISDSGSASVIIWLKRGKKACCENSSRERSENM